MHLRNVATAFLMNGNDILMMKRSEHKKIAPGFWYGVGGHLEPAELNDPKAACRREIYEETGIDATHIRQLRLRYIVMRRSREEMVINYFYFGWTDTRMLVPSDEGTLHWVPREVALDRPLFPAISLTLKHYLETGEPAAEVVGTASESDEESNENGIQLGLMTRTDGQPAILWNEVMDWTDPA